MSRYKSIDMFSVDTVESSGSSSDSDFCGEESSDCEGPATYHEWKAYVVRNVLNDGGPKRKIYEIPMDGRTKENMIATNTTTATTTTPVRPPPRPYPRPQSNNTHHQKNPLKHRLSPDSNNGTESKAKVPKKAYQPLPQSLRPLSSHDSQKNDSRRFKIPDRDASGQPIIAQANYNQSRLNPPIKTSTPKSNGSTINNTTATVTSSTIKLTTSQVSSQSSVQSSSRITKDQNQNHFDTTMTPITKTPPQANIKSVGDFWNLNSPAKLAHVKSQLDEPSKSYIDSILKVQASLQKENKELRKEKQDYECTLKMISRIASDPTNAHRQI